MWKPVVGYEGLYEVSINGYIKGLKRNKILKNHLHSKGYLKTTLHKNGKSFTEYVHRIVAKAFIEGNHNLHINHIDYNKTNNNVNNLEWCTNQENQTHRWKVTS